MGAVAKMVQRYGSIIAILTSSHRLIRCMSTKATFDDITETDRSVLLLCPGKLCERQCACRNPAHGLMTSHTGIELGPEQHTKEDNPTHNALFLGTLADHRSVKTKVQKEVRVVCNGSKIGGHS